MSGESYWIVAVPNNAGSGSAAAPRPVEEQIRLTRRQLDVSTAKVSDNFEFRIPRLKVGTLDALMSLSDELGKIDNNIEAVLKKVKRTHIEQKGKESELLVTNDEKGGAAVPPHVYIEKWDWNAAKFPVVASLKDLTTKIQQSVSAVDEELRRRTAKLAEINTAVQTIERKETGSLLVKPLGSIIKPQDVLDREYITTLLVVIPRAKEEEFLGTYELLEALAAMEKAEKEREEALRKEEALKNAPPIVPPPNQKAAPVAPKPGANAPPPSAAHHVVEVKLSAVEQAQKDADELAQQLKAEEEKKAAEAEKARKIRESKCQNVVPRSAKLLFADAEYCIYRILVFKKGADTIKNLCREKRYTVRPYEYDPSGDKAEQERKVQLIADRGKLQTAVSSWLISKYSEVMISWMHIKAIRTFTESVLRFGIPINFQAYILRPKKGSHAKLRQILSDLYSSLAGGNLTGGTEESGDLAGLTGGEFYPYVYLPLDLQDE